MAADTPIFEPHVVVAIMVLVIAIFVVFVLTMIPVDERKRPWRRK